MKRYKGYQFKQAVDELTRKVAKDFNATVTEIYWDRGVSTAGTNDCGEIVFADVADDATLFDIDVQRYVGFAVHELLHQNTPTSVCDPTMVTTSTRCTMLARMHGSNTRALMPP